MSYPGLPTDAHLLLESRQGATSPSYSRTQVLTPSLPGHPLHRPDSFSGLQKEFWEFPPPLQPPVPRPPGSRESRVFHMGGDSFKATDLRSCLLFQPRLRYA